MDVLERDFYEERRRRRRRSAFWRGFLVAAVIGGVIALLVGSAGIERARCMARFDVTGVIGDDPKRDALLDEIAAADNVRALVVRVNSPGGSTAGAEALYAALRRVAAKKPVVAEMGEVAASGGYVAAIAADHLVARGNADRPGSASSWNIPT